MSADHFLLDPAYWSSPPPSGKRWVSLWAMDKSDRDAWLLRCAKPGAPDET